MVLTAVGSPTAAAGLVTDVVSSDGQQPQRVTLPRGTVEVLAAAAPDLAARLSGGADWEWMWTSTAPEPQPGEDWVERLTAADDPEVATLLARASLRHTAVPGAPGVERWVGVRDAGALVAVGANSPISLSVPHLASIATLPDRRGEGLGAAVTATLARALLTEGRPVVTLGMYSDNDVARRVYARLGFRCEHLFSSRDLASPPDAR